MSNAVIEQERAAKDQAQIAKPAADLPAQIEANTLMQVISNAARDPSVDIEKMRALLDMKKELMRDEAKMAYAEAMNRVQEKIRPIAADASNPQTKSKYASYMALDKALRPVYTSNGFSLNFDTADGVPEGHVRVVCDVAHNAGHERRHHIDMPADGKGAKGGDVMTKTHATGSAVSYGKRYLLGMIFNVAIGQDDDGNAAGVNRDYITPDQAADIRELLRECGGDEQKFIEGIKVESVEAIYADKFDAAVKIIKAK